VFYHSLLDGTGDGDSGDCDEVVATGVANARESVHSLRIWHQVAAETVRERVVVTRINANRSPTVSAGEPGLPSSR
jgi:hypothetical protein